MKLQKFINSLADFPPDAEVMVETSNGGKPVISMAWERLANEAVFTVEATWDKQANQEIVNALLGDV